MVAVSPLDCYNLAMRSRLSNKTTSLPVHLVPTPLDFIRDSTTLVLGLQEHIAKNTMQLLWDATASSLERSQSICMQLLKMNPWLTLELTSKSSEVKSTSSQSTTPLSSASPIAKGQSLQAKGILSSVKRGNSSKKNSETTLPKHHRYSP